MRRSQRHTASRTSIAPAPPPKENPRVEYGTNRSASPVSTVTVHRPITSPREGQKLSRSIGEVEANSSDDEPLIKKFRSRRSNDGRDEGSAEEPEEPADDEEPTEEPADDEAPVEEPVDDEEPEEPADEEEEMVSVDEAPAEGVATRGAKGGGINSSERGSSNSEEDESDEGSEEDELDEDSDSSACSIRWKGSREDRRKAAKMYQAYLESNQILSSAYKGLNNKSKQKFEGKYHLGSFIY
ncbi:hypothetical protein BDN72DRAFT_904385 [Pluteus cervinus]|uniref:Uncharacterized protein n=1 Tax=Pluteus cervinus TaxID=181527 RepID=A0ACD3A6T2_9AGAR|nr:hypothetical protein BDN72DRAFT_904385 [Pluteus cervinus]